jgi:hypothetical protein
MPVHAVAAMPPIYLVVDTTPTQAPVPDKAGNRRIVLVRAFDDGDAGACARAQMHYPNREGSNTVSHCVRELPDELSSLLHDAPIAKAYVVKLATPGAPGLSYKAMFDMSMTDPAQVCHNLVDYAQRFGGLPAGTKVSCQVPRR